ncbi:MAG: bifunctional 23S rRNA (guanine(2069)-N(7))-methyltransferase RlmK/23S rRNA (guanine(2445)-N(2))-methyltransferase RlmL, partial [Gammaproteobacteria bacterium]
MELKSGPLSFFATCPKGLELLLEQELASLGAVSCRVAVAGVYFSGDTQLAYMVCLWSRLANRVLLQLAAGKITSDDDLYHLARTVPWHTLFSVEARIHVEFIGTNDEIRHTRFGAQRVKDAVVDHFVAHAQARPSVDFILPDIRLCAYLSKGTVSLALNLAGESLHKRGYRCRATPAPLKENLAAALLLRAGCMWCGNAKAGEAEAFGFVDPMCGSGTLLIEAAMMCVDRAPGLGRALTESNTVTDKHFGFAAWLGHDEALWCRIVEAAQARFAHGLRVALDRDAPAWIRGFDVHPNAVAAARANAKAAGLDALIRIEKKALEALQASDLAERPARGWVITNPPYGERMGDKKTLESLYPCLGETLKRLFTPWQAAVFTGNRDLAGALRLRVKRKYRFYNGSIDSDLLLFDLLPAAEATLRTSPAGRIAEAALSDGSTMVLNRLRKNGKRLRRWLEQTGTSCYRLYDADMPEYACAVDVYQDQFHVQEYAAPKSVSATQAAKRFQELLAAVAVYGDRPLEAIVTKIRRRHAGASQYERQETATRFGDR